MINLEEVCIWWVFDSSTVRYSVLKTNAQKRKETNGKMSHLKFFRQFLQMDGGNPINPIQHIVAKSYSKACLWLQGFCASALLVVATVDRKRNIYPLPQTSYENGIVCFDWTTLGCQNVFVQMVNGCKYCSNLAQVLSQKFIPYNPLASFIFSIEN